MSVGLGGEKLAFETAAASLVLPDQVVKARGCLGAAIAAAEPVGLARVAVRDMQGDEAPEALTCDIF